MVGVDDGCFECADKSVVIRRVLMVGVVGGRTRVL